MYKLSRNSLLSGKSILREKTPSRKEAYACIGYRKIIAKKKANCPGCMFVKY